MILTVTLNPAVDYVVFGTGFTVGTTNRGEDIPPDPGGKGNNSARVARLLGCDVMTTGILGGHTGAYIEQSLAAEGIRTAFYHVASPTRITASFVDTGNGSQTKIVPFGPRITPVDTQSFFNLVETLVAANAFSMVSMNGSVGRGMDPGVYRGLTSLCASRGIPVLLDTSGKALAAAVQVQVQGRGACPFMIKPNLDEARELCHVPAGKGLPSVLTALRELLSAVPSIALTLGADGAILLTREKCMRGLIPAVKAVNPICAGDAFVGGFLAAYDRDPADMLECFRTAIAAGTATACVTGLLWESALFHDLREQVVIEECG